MTNAPLLFAHEYFKIGSDRDLRRLVAAGHLHRVRRGVYIRRDRWEGMSADDRYRMLSRAASATVASGRQLSHDSAAALWRLPSVGPWSPSVHVLANRASGGRSTPGLARHCLGIDPNPAVVDDALVTSLARTVVDSSYQPSFARAVAMADNALRAPSEGDFRYAIGEPAPSKAELQQLLLSTGSARGATRAGRVVDFADGRSGSVGESVSRVQFMALGLPAPELQVDFYDERGFIGTVDFYWPELELIGEFDGEVKYGAQRRYQRSLSPTQVLIAEKEREDRLRRVSKNFARWGWKVALDRPRLANLLRPFGLVAGR